MKTSSHSPDTIIVVEAKLFRVVCPAECFCAYFAGRAA
jgi:hypothetical protein